MIAENFRKEILAIEVQALVQTLRGSVSSISEPLAEFSKESLLGLSIDELATLKDDLRDAVRSLGGGRVR